MKRFMRKLRKQFRHGEKGFTLIELLVVVAILGALVAIAVPAVAGFIGEGEAEAKETELGNVYVATTAALVGGEGTCVAYGTVAVPVQILVITLADPWNDTGMYLLKDTVYMYSVSAVGAITQSTDKAP